MSRRAGRFTGAVSGVNKIAGYGASMVALAIASLAIIPVMIGSDGPRAWAAIAVGQSIGGIAAVAIAYGWGLTGPAAVARAGRPGAVREYSESVLVKSILFVPLAGSAGLLAAVFAPGHALLAVVGALSTATIGLTASWYFVGLSRPYAMFVLETIPRVLGTVAGIILMLTGSGALVGVLCQLAGMLAAFVVCSVWIFRSAGVPKSHRLRHRPTRHVLVSQGLGVSSTLLSAGYIAAPLLIVSAVAPLVLPVYAIVDKVQRQVSVALNPFVTVFQGWVPRASGVLLASRVLKTLALSAVFSLALGAAMLVAAPQFILWLGGAQIHPSYLTLVLMALFVALNLFESVVSKAVLVAINRMSVVAKATLVGSILGLPLVAIGSVLFGAAGALAGILIGLVLRLGVELVAVVRYLRHPDADAPESSRNEEQQREYL
ncbi:lipopolysaccharide biosynthesis protein [Mycetocola sp.]|uniref:lipopolysaccharide biosynthesis protein n=1 Tax=Mycetocola sp. TaxID=1871042 RepID=UPI003989BB4B